LSVIKELFEIIEKYISELDKKVNTVGIDVLINNFSILMQYFIFFKYLTSTY